MPNPNEEFLLKILEQHQKDSKLRFINQGINTALGVLLGYLAFGDFWTALLFGFITFAIDGCRHSILDELRAAERRRFLFYARNDPS